MNVTNKVRRLLANRGADGDARRDAHPARRRRKARSRPSDRCSSSKRRDRVHNRSGRGEGMKGTRTARARHPAGDGVFARRHGAGSGHAGGVGSPGVITLGRGANRGDARWRAAGGGSVAARLKSVEPGRQIYLTFTRAQAPAVPATTYNVYLGLPANATPSRHVRSALRRHAELLQRHIRPADRHVAEHHAARGTSARLERDRRRAPASRSSRRANRRPPAPQDRRGPDHRTVAVC